MAFLRDYSNSNVLINILVDFWVIKKNELVNMSKGTEKTEISREMKG